MLDLITDVFFPVPVLTLSTFGDLLATVSIVIFILGTNWPRHTSIAIPILVRIWARHAVNAVEKVVRIATPGSFCTPSASPVAVSVTGGVWYTLVGFEVPMFACTTVLWLLDTVTTIEPLIVFAAWLQHTSGFLEVVAVLALWLSHTVLTIEELIVKTRRNWLALSFPYVKVIAITAVFLGATYTVYGIKVLVWVETSR